MKAHEYGVIVSMLGLIFFTQLQYNGVTGLDVAALGVFGAVLLILSLLIQFKEIVEVIT